MAQAGVHQRAMQAWCSIPHETQLLWNRLAVDVESHRPPFDHQAYVSGNNLFVSVYHGFVTLGWEHVGRLSVIHVPHAVIQTKHGRSTLGLLTAGTLCRARLGYASSFRSECAARRLSSLAPVRSSLRTLCRSSPQMTASERSCLRQSAEGTRPQLMRKTPAPLHNASCSQRTSILERPVQIAWPCSLRHYHCSTVRYLPLLLWSS